MKQNKFSINSKLTKKYYDYGINGLISAHGKN
ncbi:Uncharacterised protein [Mesomycoplasma dispar]|uniref:Uncharacterized protein n=1 Tax=Mesomycoplasma dispar TaxID=86660 RepID=A0AAJ5TCS4_9BACT|nr:Uncharacterised protein [Mesomycoplasma dispar]